MFVMLTIAFKNNFLVLAEGNQRLFNYAYALIYLGGRLHHHSWINAAHR
jgi:hypothetical protein